MPDKHQTWTATLPAIRGDRRDRRHEDGASYTGFGLRTESTWLTPSGSWQESAQGDCGNPEMDAARGLPLDD